eukprot:33021-Heterocapsa_arctica.AAC.1
MPPMDCSKEATKTRTSALSEPWSLPLSGPFSLNLVLSGDHIPHPAYALAPIVVAEPSKYT